MITAVIIFVVVAVVLLGIAGARRRGRPE